MMDLIGKNKQEECVFTFCVFWLQATFAAVWAVID